MRWHFELTHRFVVLRLQLVFTKKTNNIVLSHLLQDIFQVEQIWDKGHALFINFPGSLPKTLMVCKKELWPKSPLAQFWASQSYLSPEIICKTMTTVLHPFNWERTIPAYYLSSQVLLWCFELTDFQIQVIKHQLFSWLNFTMLKTNQPKNNQTPQTLKSLLAQKHHHNISVV